MKNNLTTCPKCDSALEISQYRCTHCKTAIDGSFSGCSFCSLDENDRLFALVFIQTEGNMKDVERVMGISYPTIKSRLRKLNFAIGGSGSLLDLNIKSDEPGASRSTAKRLKILERLKNGEIKPEEARKLLKGTH